MSSPVVVDASLATMWVVPEPFSDRALQQVECWADEQSWLLAPCFLLAEVTNALYKRVIRHEVQLAAAQDALRVLLGFGVELREEPGLAERAMELADELSRPTTYDCYYLALAEWYEGDLWTGDRRFFNAVRETHPRVKWIGSST
ncbi:hypothetical protein BH23GEM3_BH23GEM3_14660 [soil metagenome]